MSLQIAIQPDEVIHANGEQQSFSKRWIELARQQGIDAVEVDVFERDVISQISTCNAFMWRCDPPARPRLYAKRLLYAVEKGLGLPTFPSLQSSWHFEDKVAQHYYLSAAGIPVCATEVFWSRKQATQFCVSAMYPFVLKLSSGYQATNVRLVHNRTEALYYVDQLFGPGVLSLGYRPASPFRMLLRRLRVAAEIVQGRNPISSTTETELQHGYFYAQEFLPNNEFDTRVAVIGNRAFAFRRFNRPGDFRASGSGRIDWDPKQIKEEDIRLAFRVSKKMDAQTVAVDILRRDSKPVIVELTLAYASWAVRDCPGHWVLDGEPETGKLVWKDGSMRPEDAIFEDFVSYVRWSIKS